MNTSNKKDIFPEHYFQLPFSEEAKVKKIFSFKIVISFIQLFLLTACSVWFGIFAEYGFDKLLIAFSILLPIYYCLPVKFRIPLLILFFIGFIIYALGIVSTLFYILSSLFLLFFIRKSKAFWMYSMLFLCIAGLALLRLEIFYFPRLIVAVPYIAAAFMFRGMRFYYESKHGYLRSGFWLDLAYFFIPANLCFLLFGVIDPLRFSRSFKGFSAFNTGLKRIYSGFTLLVMHRVIANLFPMTFEDVSNFKNLLHYAAINYLFVLNVIGLLLAGLGTLGLCGFDLPPMFGNFLVVTSFSEMWRKVNSYWRDFIIRVFYYPTFVKLKKLPTPLRIVLSINTVFILSWLLHGYQLFWISGKPDLKLTGLLYWMIFGNLVACNVYKEFTSGVLPARSLPVRIFLATGIFITCSFLWLLWRSETVGEFIFLIRSSLSSTTFTNILPALGIVALVCGLYLFLKDVLRDKIYKIRDLSLNVIAPIFFAVLTISSFTFFGNRFPELKRSLAIFSAPTLSEEENFSRDEGYYANVISSGNRKSDPWEIHLKGEMAWGNTKGATRRTGDILLREFVPSSTTNMGTFTFKINSAGLRDDEYSVEKTSNTFRIAMLGGSNECGYGVEKEALFESITENKLDSIYAEKKIEILNFATLGSMLLQGIETTKRKVIPYEPDALLYFAHPQEYKHVARNISKLILNGIDLKYDFLNNIKKVSGATQNMSRQEIISRLLPYSEDIIKWGYAEMANDCIKNGITPVWVFLPTTKDDKPGFNYEKLSAIASLNNYVIIDLRSVYTGHEFEKVRVSGTDFHPNVLGHKLISNVFLKQLLDKKKEIGLEE